VLGIAGTALLVSAGGLLTGCGEKAPDPLFDPTERALADAAKVDGVRTLDSIPAPTKALLADLANARREHARTLTAALNESGTEGPPTPPTLAPAPEEDGTSALADVRAALDDAKREADRLVLILNRQQAGLIGSIGACCAAYRTVLS
jgi:hypothetical protein